MSRSTALTCIIVTLVLLTLGLTWPVLTKLPSLRHLFGGATTTRPVLSPLAKAALDGRIRADTATANRLAPQAAAYAKQAATAGAAVDRTLTHSLHLLSQPTHAPRRFVPGRTHADSVAYYQRLFADY